MGREYFHTRKKRSKVSLILCGISLAISGVSEMSGWKWEYMKTPGRIFFAAELIIGILLILLGVLKDRLPKKEKNEGVSFQQESCRRWESSGGIETEKRFAELKALCENGILTREEYQERVKKLRMAEHGRNS